MDFAHFHTVFAGEPGAERILWLFSLVLGRSRMQWGRFVLHHDLRTLLRCHAAAFEVLGGVPALEIVEIAKAAAEEEVFAHVAERALHFALGLRPVRSAGFQLVVIVLGEGAQGGIVDDVAVLGILATEHSAHAIVDGQFHESLDHVANRRVHATTRRVVAEHFAEEQSHLQALPNGPFQAVLRVERRITRDGMISVDGNLYSVPNATRRRVVEVHSAACEIRILEDGRLIAVYPVLEGRGRRRIAAGHRSLPPPANSHTPRQPRRPGEIVAQRSLAFYDAVARRLAGVGAGP